MSRSDRRHTPRRETVKAGPERYPARYPLSRHTAESLEYQQQARFPASPRVESRQKWRLFLYFQRFSKIPGFTPNYPRCAGCSKKMWAKIPPPACLISSKFHLSTTLNSMQGTFLGTPLHKTTSSNQHTKNPALPHHKSSESHHQIPRVDLH